MPEGIRGQALSTASSRRRAWPRRRSTTSCRRMILSPPISRSDRLKWMQRRASGQLPRDDRGYRGRISEAVVSGGWRAGAPFLNAAAEYPTSAVRQQSMRRAWYQHSLRKLLATDGDPVPPSPPRCLSRAVGRLTEAAILMIPMASPGFVSEAQIRRDKSKARLGFATNLFSARIPKHASTSQPYLRPLQGTSPGRTNGHN